MRTQSFFFFFVLLFSLTLSGCKDDDDPDPDNNKNTSGLSAQVDGESYSSISVDAVENTSYTAITGTFNENGKGITINIAGIAEDTFDVGQNSTQNSATYNMDGGSQELAQSGTVEITEYDEENNYVEGNFNFETENHAITEGSFEIDY